MSIFHYSKEFTLKIPFEIYLCCFFFICTTSVMVEYEPRTRKQGKDFFDLLADPSLKAEKSDEEGKQYPWHRMDCSPSNQSEFRVIWYFTKVTPDGVSENKTVLRDPNENRYLENPSVLRVRHVPGSEGFYSCRIVDSEGNYQEARSALVFPDYPLMNLYWDNRVILRKSHLYRPVRLVSNTIRLHTNEKYFMSEEIIMHQYASTAMSHLPSNTLMWYSYYDSNKISFMETYPNVPTNAMEIVEGSAIAATVSVLRLKLHNSFLKDVRNDSTELKPYEMVLIRAYDPQYPKKSFVKTFHKDEYTCCKYTRNCISCFTVDFYGLSPNRVYNFTTRWVHRRMMGNESIPKTLRTPNSSRRPPSVSKIQVISITGTSLRIAWYPPAHRTSFDIGYLVTVDSGKDERSQQFGPDEFSLY
ncbi:hypothetical protein GCK32_005214 [Trichostrongylus colubriformis]|uniref:Ig-like domain-containing protein n=1 Tax=Trichostrongylus colubriformis TaxID=6319 RepID=A0AAN8IDR8_TRICO